MKVVVGLSGGVDSAVAALLLRRAGHEVQGLFMANWEEDDSYCTIAEDYQDARAVCRELDIPLHRVNFAAEYRQRVFDYFLQEYQAGRTPNPDVLCNREIKFGVCLGHARRLGAERLATGHYARRIEGERGASDPVRVAPNQAAEERVVAQVVREVVVAEDDIIRSPGAVRGDIAHQNAAVGAKGRLVAPGAAQGEEGDGVAGRGRAERGGSDLRGHRAPRL